MKRTTITFYDEIYQKIENRTKKRELQSIAQCIREMIELLFKIEEAAEKTDGKGDKMDLFEMIIELKNLLKNNLTWSLETRFLSRFLVENYPDETQEKRIEILEKYKESAANYVKGLMGDSEV